MWILGGVWRVVEGRKVGKDQRLETPGWHSFLSRETCMLRFDPPRWIILTVGQLWSMAVWALGRITVEEAFVWVSSTCFTRSSLSRVHSFLWWLLFSGRRIKRSHRTMQWHLPWTLFFLCFSSLNDSHRWQQASLLFSWNSQGTYHTLKRIT